MNYRCLTEAELEPLRADFIQFLAANGIAGEDWKKIQHSDEGRAWVVGFSQVVWEKSLPKISTLQLRQPNAWTCISIGNEKMRMLRLSNSSSSNIRFDADNWLKILEEEASSLIAAGKLEMSTGEKAIEKERNQEVYSLMQQGFEPCSPVMFTGLEKLLS